MTTINAAAAVHVGKRGRIAAFALIIAVGMAGCSTNGGDLLQSNNSPLATDSTTAPSRTSRAKIALAPVIGAPSTIASQIVAQVSGEIGKQNIQVAKTPNEKVDYTLRGYIVAAREATGTKVSYIWDVTNPKGARVHRITGEEVVKGAGPGDPWASVSPQLIQVIASKTSQKLGQWMPQKAAPAPSATPVAAAGSATATAASQVASSGTAAASTQGAKRVASTASRATTGSIPKTGTVTALVPTVQGAPGDGSRSLAAALRNELMRNGVKPAAPGMASYRVEGRVKMGAAEAGQQPIKIDWVVKDPRGGNLGTVSQENKIPAGSLDGAWGGTATAAAVAATQGILKLLPKQTASR